MIVHFVEMFGIVKTLFSEQKQTNKQTIYSTNIDFVLLMTYNKWYTFSHIYETFYIIGDVK